MRLAKMVLFFVLSVSCGQSEEKSVPQRLSLDYSREAREEMQNGLFSDLPEGLEDHDILGWNREDIAQTEEYALLRFSSQTDREEAIVLTRRAGYRPANMDELAVYAKDNLRSNIGRSPVFAIGTVWKNRTFYPYLPYLFRSSGGIGLGLWFAWDKLPSDAQFLSIKMAEGQNER